MQLKELSIVRSVLVISVLHIPFVASDSNSNDMIQVGFYKVFHLILLFCNLQRWKLQPKRVLQHIQRFPVA